MPLAVVLTGTLMIVLDFFIVNVMLPSIQQGMWVSAEVWACSRPGLLLVGAGQGLCITPLASIVMSRLDPERAGAASGPLSTMQQVGNSLGVAITGVIFFAVLPHHGFAGAFEASAVQLGGLALLVVAVSQLLPGNATGQMRSALGLALKFRRPVALGLMRTKEDVDGTR